MLGTVQKHAKSDDFFPDEEQRKMTDFVLIF